MKLIGIEHLQSGLEAVKNYTLNYLQETIQKVTAALEEMKTSKANAVHTHQAKEVTFEDGDTFQQKLDDGELKGATGPQGLQGATGDTWVPTVSDSGDLTWEKNASSTPAAKNIKGPQGNPGKDGAAGAKGDTGAAAGFGKPVATIGTGTGGTPSVTVEASGEDTAKVFTFNFDNLKGAKGDTGPAGTAGAAGAKGADGVTWVPSVDGTGLLSWAKGTASSTAPESVNIKGPQGATGPAGPAGPAGSAGATGPAGAAGAAAGFGTPQVTVDSGTGTPGCTITATGEDTKKVFTFNFTNLKGATGPAGPAGPTGPAGAAGKDGAAGAKGDAGPNTVSTTTTTNITGILKGDGKTVLKAVEGTDYAAANHTHDYAKKPSTVTLSIAAGDWTSNSCTKPVAGVTASETDALIIPTPAMGSLTAYIQSGVKVTAQGSGTLTFSCDTKPFSTLIVYVVIIPLK